jgi:hypothetical protein
VILSWVELVSIPGSAGLMEQWGMPYWNGFRGKGREKLEMGKAERIILRNLLKKKEEKRDVQKRCLF